MAARSPSTAARENLPNLRYFCRGEGSRGPHPKLPRLREEKGSRAFAFDDNSKEDSMSFSVLVVDDEPDVAEMFRQRFRREARRGTYVLHFAASGEEALDKLENGVQPELIVILSDINMPGMDGLTLLREIKTRRP